MNAVRRITRGAVTRAVVVIRSTPRPLAVLLILAALEAVAWAAATAPLQGADEEGHVGYVQHLVETGHAPRADGTGSPISTEEGHALTDLGLGPIVSNQNARPSFQKVDHDRFDQFEQAVTPAQRADGTEQNALAKNPPLYYLLDAVPYALAPSHSFLSRLFFMRLYSCLLYVLTVLFAWLVAAELFALQWPRVLATAVVLLQPKLAYLGAIVNPDIQLVAIWTAFAWLAVRTVRRGPTTARVLGIGALAGASALTHARGLALVPPAALAVLLTFVRHRAGWRTWARDGGIAAAVALGCLAFAVSFSSAHSTGGAFGGSAAKAASTSTGNLRQFLSYLWQFYLPKLSFMQPKVGVAYGYRQVYIETFYSSQGALEVVYKPSTMDALQLASALGLLLLYTQAIAFRALLVRYWREVLIFASMCVSQLGLLHIAAYHDLLTSPGEPLITGRYLMPMISIFGVSIAFVCSTLPRRVGATLAGVILGAGVALQLSGLALSVARFYA
jgi:4-amino-4-deoxy-L-arabinose transferase-like glycosyltransferase